jgi:hypothetical protein
MGKKAKIIIIVLVAIVAGYVVLGAMNFVPFPFINQSENYPGAIELDVSIDDLTTGMDLDQETDTLLHKITLKVYGINDVTAEDAHDWFKSKLLGNGWTLLGEDNDSGPVWDGYWSGWQKGLMGFFVAAFDGPAVVERTGYDVAVVTGIAPMWTFK